MQCIITRQDHVDYGMAIDIFDRFHDVILIATRVTTEVLRRQWYGSWLTYAHT
jgi:hypothetical protein